MNDRAIRWERPPDRADVGTRETDVWCFATDDPSLDDATLESLLAPGELARAGRLFATADRRLYVVGRAMLRTLLGRYVGVDPRELSFGQAETGKPRLDGAGSASNLRFNVSGSGEIVLIAVRWRHDVGVDVEKLAAHDEAAIESAMSARELAAWRRLGGIPRVERFTALWAGKEAVAKAVGSGLGLKFADVELPGHSGCVHVAAPAGSGRRTIPVSIMPLPPPRPGFAAALASVAPFECIRLWSPGGAY